jgi:hypothetical protein
MILLSVSLYLNIYELITGDKAVALNISAQAA